MVKYKHNGLNKLWYEYKHSNHRVALYYMYKASGGKRTDTNIGAYDIMPLKLMSDCLEIIYHKKNCKVAWFREVRAHIGRSVGVLVDIPNDEALAIERVKKCIGEYYRASKEDLDLLEERFEH